MSVRKRAGFLSQNLISELVWDSDGEEAGAIERLHHLFGQQNFVHF